MKGDVRLEWVRSGDKIVHVSDVAHIEKPGCTCPECNEVVTLRRGEIRRHHAAHRPGSRCALSSAGESVEHFNTKYYIARELRKTDALRAVLKCRECRKETVVAVVFGYDEVKVEQRLGDKLQPDILLLRGGVAIGCVEVFVSNQISLNKAERLAQNSITWIEVEASNIFSHSSGADGWTYDAPIPSRACRRTSIVCKCDHEWPVRRRRAVVRDAPAPRPSLPGKVSPFFSPAKPCTVCGSPWIIFADYDGPKCRDHHSCECCASTEELAL